MSQGFNFILKGPPSYRTPGNTYLSELQPRFVQTAVIKLDRIVESATMSSRARSQMSQGFIFTLKGSPSYRTPGNTYLNKLRARYAQLGSLGRHVKLIEIATVEFPGLDVECPKGFSNKIFASSDPRREERPCSPVASPIPLCSSAEPNHKWSRHCKWPPLGEERPCSPVASPIPLCSSAEPNHKWSRPKLGNSR
jgi:hypothetical protein